MHGFICRIVKGHAFAFFRKQLAIKAKNCSKSRALFLASAPGESLEWILKMRASINPPPLQADDEKYLAQCLFALEPSIEGLVHAAVHSGWKRSFVLASIIAIAVDRVEDAAAAPSLHS